MVKCGFFSVISVISSFVIQCRQLPSQHIVKWFKYTRNPSMQQENVVIVPQSAVLKPGPNPTHLHIATDDHASATAILASLLNVPSKTYYE
jgi:hypothetical protein